MAELLYPEGFYETTLAADLSASATTVSLSTVPSDVTKGYLIIEPASATKREVVYFSSVGAASVTTTDDTTDTGDATGRGCKGSVTVGANTSHDQGVTVIIANSYQYIKRIYDALAKVVIASSGDAGFTLGSDADGDIYYRASGKLARLAKGTALQGLRMNSSATAPEWGSVASFWTAFSGAYASGTTLTVSGSDVTGVMKKGVVLKWQKSDNTFKTGMVISSSYSDPNTTITIVGSTAESGDKNFYYAGELANKETFIIPGNQSTGTDVSKTWFNPTPIYKISVDAYNKTAGTTGNTVYDLNIGGTTCMTTKPTIASAGTSDLNNVCDNVTTEIAVDSAFTVDIDTATTTQAVDGYITLFYIPTSWMSLT